MENRREMMTEKKEKYVKPEMEIIEFEAGDVIVTSTCAGNPLIPSDTGTGTPEGDG